MFNSVFNYLLFLGEVRDPVMSVIEQCCLGLIRFNAQVLLLAPTSKN